MEQSQNVIIEQIIRPTGLLDPIIEIKSATNQIADLVVEIRKTAEKNARILVTTLTKKMSEELTEYLKDKNLKVKYLHSEINNLERVEILQRTAYRHL